MTILRTVLDAAQSAVATPTSPAMGAYTSYDASAGSISNTLPALLLINAGAVCVVEKSQNDATLNPVTFVCAAGDQFDDGTTGFTLYAPGDQVELQCVSILGLKYWKVVNTVSFPRVGGIHCATTEQQLSNSTTATTLITHALIPGLLNAGSTFRISLAGAIELSTGTLTFTPMIQGVALLQTAVLSTQIASSTAYDLDCIVTVRTTGAAGTAVAKPMIMVATATPTVKGSTTTGTATVNTTGSATSQTVAMQAMFSAASASNVLYVETATIERIM